MLKIAKVYSIVFTFGLTLACSHVVAEGAGANDPIGLALGMRHMSVSAVQLEEMAGGQEALIKKLLELRSEQNRPFVGVRAEKLLLGYAERSDVQDALVSDLLSEKLAGHARLITMHIDNVTDVSARRRLAESALKRAKRDSDFASHARALISSTDVEISRLAREALVVE